MFSLSPAQSRHTAGAIAGHEKLSPLQIGDTIPEELWNHQFRLLKPLEGTGTIALRSYRDKELIILDLWSTWCGSCITSIQHRESLERKYGSQIVILPVTGQSYNEVKEFGKRNEVIGSTSLPIIVEDSILSAYFPYQSLPHIVFLNKNGEVVHIGGLESTTENSIVSLLNGDMNRMMRTKNDFSFRNPLIASMNKQVGGSIYYNILSGYRKDAAAIKGVVVDSVNRMKRFYFYNQSLMQLIGHALSTDSLRHNRVIFRHSKWNFRNFGYHRTLGNRYDWLSQNALCFEANLPMEVNDITFKHLLLQSLKTNLGINITFDQQPVSTLRITGVNRHVKKNNVGTDSILSGDLIDAYNRFPDALPLVDPEGYATNYYIDKVNYEDWKPAELIAALAKGGLNIDTVKSDLPVLIIEGR